MQQVAAEIERLVLQHGDASVLRGLGDTHARVRVRVIDAPGASIGPGSGARRALVPMVLVHQHATVIRVAIALRSVVGAPVSLLSAGMLDESLSGPGPLLII